MKTHLPLQFKGPDNEDIPVSLERISPRHYSLHFETQHLNGGYELKVGPYIEDVLGNDMDHNAGGLLPVLL
jgi:hypothetical protein